MNRGRPKKFDEQQALMAAMEVFWKRGYEEASCDELLAAMGINCGSMYATFGDKKALFERAFDLYAQTVFSKSIEILDQPGSPLANVRTLVNGWCDFMSHPDCKGCLIGSAVIHFGRDESAIGERAKRLMSQIQNRLQEKLNEARLRGEWIDQADPGDTAAFLINTAYGLSVMSRAGVGTETLRGVVNTALLLLK